MSEELPRNFRLLDELEMGEKEQDLPAGISFGLADTSDSTLTDWVGTLIGPAKTTFENRFYMVNIKCGENYPNVAPTVSFQTKVELPFVDKKGKVLPSKFNILGNWDKKTKILDILQGILQAMKDNGKTPQPPDDLY